MTTGHVFAIPTDADGCYEPIDLDGTADSVRLAIVRARVGGYDVITDDRGGHCRYYDAEDAPRIFGYEPDGLGAYGITVAPECE